MARTLQLVSVALVLAFVGSACCGRKAAPTPTLTEPLEPSAAPTATVATMPPAGPAGWAYVKGRELVAIDPSGKLSKIASKKGYVSELVRASDGSVYALISDTPAAQIALVTGNSMRVVGELPKCYVSGSAFDARGDHMAIKCQEGIYEKSGAKWNEVPLPGDAYEHALWIAKDGALWYGSNKGIFERKGASWTQPQGVEATSGRPSALLDGPDGVYFVRSSDVLRVANGKVEELHKQKPGKLGIETSSNGLFGFWDSGSRGELVLYTIAGEVKTVSTKAWMSRGRLDDTGRVWAITDGQLEITEPKTGTVTTIPMGSYPELDELTISASVVALGSGPALPAPRAVRHTKRITGKLALDGKPLADAQVELCPRSGWTFGGDTPCSGADETLILKAKTDAKGAFSFDNAPMGLYYLHYKAMPDSKWAIDSTAFEHLKENGVTNVGTLSYVSSK